MHTPVRLYKTTLEIAFALLPGLAILYLYRFSSDAPPFKHHAFHELAIALAVLIGVFVAYITWRCYLASGERFLRWLALGFIGFALVYLPHGLLTPISDGNPGLFLLYGPASRLVLIACLLFALFQMGRPPDPPLQRRAAGFWAIGLAVLILVDLLVAFVAQTLQTAWPRMLLEVTALSMMLAAILILLLRGPGSPLMRIYLISIAAFAQSSLAFLLLARIWDHQWWLAHTIFAAGFLLLSYGVAHAYLASGSFISVYGLEEVFTRLRQEKARTERALTQLERANRDLQQMATVDALTGLNNRRHFFELAERSLERIIFEQSSLSLLLLDLDHFKQVNDQYGHQAGDSVLSQFSAILQQELRPGDLCGRFGGEEFLVLLPHTTPDEARSIADRLQQAVAGAELNIEGGTIAITVSIGIAHLRSSADNLHSMLQCADRGLYSAKEAGRNRVRDGAR